MRDDARIDPNAYYDQNGNWNGDGFYTMSKKVNLIVDIKDLEVLLFSVGEMMYANLEESNSIPDDQRIEFLEVGTKVLAEINRLYMELKEDAEPKE